MSESNDPPHTPMVSVQKPLAGAENVMLRLHGDQLIANETVPVGRYEGQYREFECEWRVSIEGDPISLDPSPDCSSEALRRAEDLIILERAYASEHWSRRSPEDWAELFQRLDAQEMKDE